jgi:hypothetical protein
MCCESFGALTVVISLIFGDERERPETSRNCQKAGTTRMMGCKHETVLEKYIPTVKGEIKTSQRTVY